MNPVIYRVDHIEVDSTKACLRAHGQEVHLKPKTFRILLHLIVHHDRLVAKEEIMDLFWKDTAVTDDALTQCIGELRRALGDNSRNPTYLKTVPRMGYRFVGSVVELEAAPAQRVEIEVPQSLDNRKRRPVWLAAAAILMAALSAAALWTNGVRPAAQGLAKRQVAVVRFENRSGQPELDWLREGLPEMLATTFSRSRALDVVSRERVALKGGAPPVEGAMTLARSVHASAAVMGSFSKLGDSMRVDVRVYQVDTGALIASEDITVDRQDQLLTQIDFLALRLAARLAPAPADQDRRVLTSLMTDNLEAYRYYSLGLEKADALQTAEAISLFEKALAIDPGFVMAAARIGYAHAVTDVELEKGRKYLERAFRMSSRLTEKDRRHIVAWYAIANRDYPAAIRRYNELIVEYPNEVEAYLRLGALLRGESRHEEAIEILRRGIALDPEDPRLANALAAVYSEMGRHEDALAMATRYVMLAPNVANAYDSLGLAYHFAGQFDRALEAFAKAIELKPDFEIVYFHRAAVYGQMGRVKDGIRESLHMAESGTTVTSRRRGWDEAAMIAWRAGEMAAARAFANRAIALDIGEIEGASLAYFQIAKFVNKHGGREAFAGRGGRFGQRDARLILAEEAKRDGRTKDRLELLRQAMQFHPSWADQEPGEDALADAYLEMGRVDEAILEYERALKMYPGLALARYRLAKAYLSKGLQSAAQQQFHKFVELWKDADSDLPELVDARNQIK